eukprot:COSAG03_NODE_3342_length_2069_cov_2.472589_2_plen_142_part_00
MHAASSPTAGYVKDSLGQPAFVSLPPKLVTSVEPAPTIEPRPPASVNRLRATSVLGHMRAGRSALAALLLLLTLSLAVRAEEQNESAGAAEQAAYDPEDPALDHTAVAIAFAEAGEDAEAEEAFRAAVKHGRSVNSLVNLR